MIYCLSPSDYPTIDKQIEELIYIDENGFEWKIARVKNGFFVKYFGDDYFRESYFNCELPNGKTILINNTNCIFIQDTDFETFAEMRTILKNGYTDDIWETFEEMLEERFLHDLSLLESEIF